ncbi:MAG: winged helix-turn-helix domain-containing protein [Bacillota bacterium]
MKQNCCQEEKYSVNTDEQKRLRYGLRVFITQGDGLKGSFGIGINRLMHGIQKYGSLSKSAEEMGMAYSKAWKILKHMEDYLGFQMVFRQVGRGCGSSLTKKGADFIRRYDAFISEVNQFAEDSFKRHFQDF